MELRNLEAYGEPGAIVYRVDCVELMRLMPVGSVGAIFADPPYRLSGGGVTVRSGRLAPVDKGDWDRSMGIGKDLKVTFGSSVRSSATSSPTVHRG